jgi:hypothetical protein
MAGEIRYIGLFSKVYTIARRRGRPEPAAYVEPFLRHRRNPTSPFQSRDKALARGPVRTFPATARIRLAAIAAHDLIKALMTIHLQRHRPSL